jgi:hypothetical protein
LRFRVRAVRVGLMLTDGLVTVLDWLAPGAVAYTE